MILDTLDRAPNYFDLSAPIARGLAWLSDFSPSLPDGRYDIDGDEVFALVQSYETVAPAEKKFESHRNYLDIQYVALGTEVIYYAALRSLNPVTTYEAEKDFLLYGDPKHCTPIYFEPGVFTIFFPQDGHKPGCVNGATAHVKKVVVKVRV